MINARREYEALSYERVHRGLINRAPCTAVSRQYRLPPNRKVRYRGMTRGNKAQITQNDLSNFLFETVVRRKLTLLEIRK